MAGQAEVAAMLRNAVAEMENLGIVDDNRGKADEELPKMNRCSFEPKNRNIEEPKDMNEYVLSYFESLNNMNRRIIAVQREAMADNKNRWNELTPEEQERIIDDYLVHPSVRKQYDEPQDDIKKHQWFPVLKLAHGISGSSTDINQSHRDSITSVSELFARDQFSTPWSWETQSQQDLRLLQEGELEAEINKAIEEQNENPEVPAELLRHKASIAFDLESKDSSRSGSGVGSALLRRKAYLDPDPDSHGASSTSSVHGSKGSLNMPSSKASLSTEHLCTAEVLPTPKEETPTPPDTSTTLVSPPVEDQGPASEDTKVSPPVENAPASEDTKNLEMATESNDLMEFLQNW